MALSRKEFLTISALGTAPLVLGKIPIAASGTASLKSARIVSREMLLATRLGFGPRKNTLGYIKAKGMSAYIDEQLHPVLESDPEYFKRVQAMKFEVKYYSKTQDKFSETRKIEHLEKNLPEMREWYKRIQDKPYEEWIWPATQVMASTWLRAVYSKWQLNEVLVEFWHNHFNVTINGKKEMGSTFVHYDRDVIRKNAFGNFREFVEQVGQAPAMLYYLNNDSSKASPANENYARELIELHTLGEENYLNHKYSYWKDVPGAIDADGNQGIAEGYIDEDVYEAARAFTGWTVADGRTNWRQSGSTFPDNGEFYYVPSWHDNYQKRVMGQEVRSNQPPLQDGRQVLDIVCFHPATAERICRKLCQRFISDNPPEELVQKAKKVWIAENKSPDQIRKVLEVILKSEFLLASRDQKVKKPYELVASFLRAMDFDFTPNQMLFWNVGSMGYSMFQWPAPTGHPEDGAYWTTAGMMVTRWKTCHTILHWRDMGIGDVDLVGQTPKGATYNEAVDFWSHRLLNSKLEGSVREKAVLAFADGSDPNSQIPTADWMHWRFRTLVAMISMSPQFQYK